MEKKKRKKERTGVEVIEEGGERNAASPLSSRFSFDSYLSSYRDRGHRELVEEKDSSSRDSEFFFQRSRKQINK